ncbi:MAG TPA: hypothetical protein GXX14_11760 [Clostridiaceae bacterium]|nr:hypothetical protein [Clostridiaceae bacterium]
MGKERGLSENRLSIINNRFDLIADKDETPESLFAKARAGDIQAFELLIDPYLKKIYSIMLNVYENSEDASRISQEVFIKAFRELINEKGKSVSIQSIIYKTAKELLPMV